MKKIMLSITLLIMAFAQDEFNISLKKGEVFDIVAANIKSTEAFQEAKKTYFPKVFPMATKHGMKSLATLFNAEPEVDRHFTAGAFVFAKWPSEDHLSAFGKEKSWPELKALRNKYWHGLRVNHLPVKEDMTLTFKKNKKYSILYMWNYGFVTDQKNFYGYIKKVNPLLAKHGGKVLASFTGGSFEALNNDRKADRITIIEWPSDEARNGYANSAEREKYTYLFNNAVSESEVFNMYVR